MHWIHACHFEYVPPRKVRIHKEDIQNNSDHNDYALFMKTVNIQCMGNVVQEQFSLYSQDIWSIWKC